MDHSIFEHFNSSIENFLFILVDNLVTNIEIKNCKDFTVEDDGKWI